MEIPYVVTPRKDTGLFNSKIAIWLFLASEVMLFGGFFSAYVFLRLGADYPWPERTLPVLPGLLNTFILIASSVTVVFAWASLKMRQWFRFQVFMSITVICAVVFMGFKALEYYVKFHHAAVRMEDYSVVEGHLGYEKEGGFAHGEGDEHAGEDGHGDDHGGEYLHGVDGEKIQANHHRFEASAISYDLARYHEPWVERHMARAESEGVRLKLAETFNLNREGAEEVEEDKIVKEGTALSFEVLEKMRDAFEENRNFNARWRTKFLREAWDEKWAEVEREDRMSESAFAAEYPELQSDREERDKAFARWKAGMRARLATEVDLNEAVLEKDGREITYADIERPVRGTAKFNVGGEEGGSAGLLLRFDSHDVISDYDADAESISLRDNTTVSGGYLPSPMVFHNADGIDFQHLAMQAERKNQDPMLAIEESWLIRENPVVAELWEKHRKAIGLLEEKLAAEGREPTEKDRYRMDWQNIAYYMERPLEDVELRGNKNSAPKVEMTLGEQFKGPDYEKRSFPHISIPREQVALDSMFTPRWNTYYSIYFAITGLHGLHVIGGAIVLGYYLFFGRKMYLSNPEWLANRVEVGGLFWHFVDLIWIFAFPIFYLM